MAQDTVPCYEMNCKYAGRVVLINLSSYSPDLPKANRRGSEADLERLMVTFQKLGFQRDHMDICDNNPSYDYIMNTIRSVVKEDHSAYNMFACVVMTHGGQVADLCASDKEFNLKELWEQFSEEKCHTLAGKPKIFITQACRGNILDYGVKVKWPSKRSSRQKTGSDWIADGGTSVLPHRPEFVHDPRLTPTGVVRQFTDDYYPVKLNCVHDVPDMLIAHSTLPSFYSFLTVDGSPFIQTLCDKLEEFHATDHLLGILTRVNSHVAIEVQSRVKNPYQAEFDKAKQMSCFVSSFTKLLYFNRGCVQ